MCVVKDPCMGNESPSWEGSILMVSVPQEAKLICSPPSGCSGTCVLNNGAGEDPPNVSGVGLDLPLWVIW